MYDWIDLQFMMFRFKIFLSWLDIMFYFLICLNFKVLLFHYQVYLIYLFSDPEIHLILLIIVIIYFIPSMLHQLEFSNFILSYFIFPVCSSII